MTDIDHPLLVERSAHGREEKANMIGAKGLDHRQHILSFLFADHFDELLQSLWTTHYLAISPLDRCEEHLSSGVGRPPVTERMHRALGARTSRGCGACAGARH
jgi:hypothetical protein